MIRVRHFLLQAAFIVCAAITASQALATTVTATYSVFADPVAAYEAQEALPGIVDREAFETYAAASAGQSGATATPLISDDGVFGFTTIGGDVCALSCTEPENQAVIRNSNQYGRLNTSPGGSNWLDSNDNVGLIIDIDLTSSVPNSLTALSFLLSDVNDVSDLHFVIDAHGDAFDLASDFFNGARQPNGQILLVYLEYDTPVETTQVSLTGTSGDGFGLDDVAIHRVSGAFAPSPAPLPSPAPVPLPGAAGLLTFALMGLAFWTKRQD